LGIFGAAMKGDLGQPREAFEASPRVIDQPGPGGWPALHLAAHFGQESAVNLLLELGANIEQRSANSNKNTPLHAAVAGGHKGTTLCLLQRRADINADYGGTLVVHEAAFKGNPELIELLISWRADPTAYNAHGETPAMIAQKQHGEGVAFAVLIAAERAAQQKTVGQPAR
jgi:uncharacterized protein